MPEFATLAFVPRRLPKSARKFLRRKKAEIRRQFLSLGEAEKKVGELVAAIAGRYNKGKGK
ncbi:MAG: hypothetical protein HYT42_02545 [Candidatus Sungbacteria bacterium]|nr:hypothetical protein [Candidatus Sungbacteria bacterium]